MTSTRRKQNLLAITVLLLVVAVSAWWLFVPQADTDSLRIRAERYFSRGQYTHAEQLYHQILKAEPEAHDIRLRAAECAAADARPLDAVQQIEQITTDNDDLKLQAELLRATLLHRSLLRLTEAESVYRNVLKIAPQQTEALTGIVQLLATCGRRREALPFIIELIRQEEASDLLIVAARSTGAINDLDFLNRVIQTTPDDASALLGLAMHASQAGDRAASIDYCRRAIAARPDLVAAYVALGQYLLDAGRYKDLEDWQRKLPRETAAFAETWEVAGHLFEHKQNPGKAVEAYQEALRLGPELKTACFRLSVLCRQAGDKEAAEYFLEHLAGLRELEELQDRMFASGTDDPTIMTSAIQCFAEKGRLWEALGWATLGTLSHAQNPELRGLHQELTQRTQALPRQLYMPDSIPTRSLDADLFLSSAVHEKRADSANTTASSGPISDVADRISFQNDADSSGLRFRFRNGVEGPSTHRMFEFTGGGIGVIDVDADDYPDVFLTQGGYWPSEKRAPEARDAVFRNQQGKKFTAVTDQAGIVDEQFGQGVAVGDVNGDGFPDVLVANIGLNRLWINSGDGTFTSQFLREDHRTEKSPDVESVFSGEWSSSVAIADLNRDGAPDIYVANYLAGDDVFSRVCPSADGIPQACIPVQFDAAADELWLNQQDGEFHDASEQLSGISAGKGLGVLVMSTGCNGEVVLYVANDTTANMLLKFDSIAQDRIQDIAVERGVAFNRAGKAEGSMGIAATDLNGDERMEIFVTNFLNESNTLYQQTSEGYFEDLTRQWNLVESSMPLLGFGTQFLDADGDLVPELFVANGHVDDLRHTGKPYKMRAQLLTLKDFRFEEVRSPHSDSWLADEHLGRAVALIDWNRDLRPDMLVGDLVEEYALLTNTSQAQHQTLSLRLIGVVSARDGLLATVSYRVANRDYCQQLTAGDGYFCSNQKHLLLCCPPGAHLSDVRIRWASGTEQTLQNLRPGQRYAAVESRHTVITLPD